MKYNKHQLVSYILFIIVAKGYLNLIADFDISIEIPQSSPTSFIIYY